MSDSAANILQLLVPDLVNVSIISVGTVSELTQSDFSKLARSSVISELVGSSPRFDQGIVADAAGGIVASITVQGIRSFKAVTLSPVRLEVHNRSGLLNPQENGLPQMARKLFEVAETTGLQAIGVNFEVLIQSSLQSTAAKEIAHRILKPELLDFGKIATFSGISSKFFFETISGYSSSVSIEPRWNDVDSPTIWIQTNTNADISDVPDEQFINELYDEAKTVLVDLLTRIGLPVPS